MISSSIQSKLKADEVLGMRVLPQKDEERILFYIKKSKEAKKRKESLNTFAALVYGYEETNFSLGDDKSQPDSSFKFRFDSSSQVKRSWRTLIPIPKKKYNIVSIHPHILDCFFFLIFPPRTNIKLPFGNFVGMMWTKR